MSNSKVTYADQTTSTEVTHPTQNTTYTEAELRTMGTEVSVLVAKVNAVRAAAAEKAGVTLTKKPEPKRTALGFFKTEYKEMLDQLAKENSAMPVHALAVQEFNKLHETERVEFETMAKEDADRHDGEMGIWDTYARFQITTAGQKRGRSEGSGEKPKRAKRTKKEEKDKTEAEKAAEIKAEEAAAIRWAFASGLARQRPELQVADAVAAFRKH